MVNRQQVKEARPKIIGALIVVGIILAIGIPLALCWDDIMEHLAYLDRTPKYCGVITDKHTWTTTTTTYDEDGFPHTTYHHHYKFIINDELSGILVHHKTTSYNFHRFIIGNNITVFLSGRIILNS